MPQLPGEPMLGDERPKWWAVMTALAVSATALACNPFAVCACDPVPPQPDSVTLSPALDTVAVGDSSRLTATLWGGQWSPVATAVSASPSGLVTVALDQTHEGEGFGVLVTGVAPGTATVTADVQGVVGRATVVVIPSGASATGR